MIYRKGYWKEWLDTLNDYSNWHLKVLQIFAYVEKQMRLRREMSQIDDFKLQTLRRYICIDILVIAATIFITTIVLRPASEIPSFYLATYTCTKVHGSNGWPIRKIVKCIVSRTWDVCKISQGYISSLEILGKNHFRVHPSGIYM